MFSALSPKMLGSPMVLKIGNHPSRVAGACADNDDFSGTQWEDKRMLRTDRHGLGHPPQTPHCPAPPVWQGPKLWVKRWKGGPKVGHDFSILMSSFGTDKPSMRRLEPSPGRGYIGTIHIHPPFPRVHPVAAQTKTHAGCIQFHPADPASF